MQKISLSSKKAPAATGPFSQAIIASNKYRLELSGQIGLDPEKGELVEGGLTAQTERTFENIKGVLSEVGWDFDNIIKVRVYLTDMGNYAELNEIYSKKFGEKAPARVVVAVKELPLKALVEIECLAEGDEISEIAK
ncbi:Rid family detoxifying hydrolase [Patescibacteria group bacterium]